MKKRISILLSEEKFITGLYLILIGLIVLEFYVYIALSRHEQLLENVFSRLVTSIAIVAGTAPAVLLPLIFVADLVEALINSVPRNASILIEPPKILSNLVALLVPKQDRENMFGDIDEGFPKLEKRIGRHMATIVYVKDIISMALPSIQKLLMKIGVVTGLWEYIKRKLL